jgi:plasmid maintenance system antidote protein VapI
MSTIEELRATRRAKQKRIAAAHRGANVERLLEKAELSQRGAARALEINERTMRRYCSGDSPAPRVVLLALAYLRDNPRERE